MSKVALIIVFNHKYNKNIEPLRQMYKERFSNIHFLIPFYEGVDRDVTPVYESSFYFEGYIAQGFKNFQNKDVEHYLFVADDMVLNPAINEDTYQVFFGINNNESFIPEIFSLHNLTNDDTLLFEHHQTLKRKEKKRFWWRTKSFYEYSPKREGTEGISEIPSYEEAKNILAQHGYLVKPLTYWDIWGSYDPTLVTHSKPKKIWQFIKNIKKVFKLYPLSYPLVASYSDILIVDKSSIQKFVQYCGVFAATELFVEVAIPTALLLAAKKVKTEPAIGKRGMLYWNYLPEQINKYNSDMKSYNYELSKLLVNFPSDKLYMHPIKLSKWKTDI
jgi:hypothetical protein